jgi:hypothetical protein
MNRPFLTISLSGRQDITAVNQAVGCEFFGFPPQNITNLSRGPFPTARAVGSNCVEYIRRAHMFGGHWRKGAEHRDLTQQVWFM